MRLPSIKRIFLGPRSNDLGEGVQRRLSLTSTREVHEEDVFVCGYPKSGNTWMQFLLTGLLLDSTSLRVSPQIVESMVPDLHKVNYFKRMLPNMCFKTHSLPDPLFRRVIHLVRDGRDALVSYYRMELNVKGELNYGIEELLTNERVLFPCSWQEHTREWLRNPFDAQMLLLRFEDLVDEPLLSMQRISSFLGLEFNDKRLMEIYLANSMDRMKERINMYGWQFDDAYPDGRSLSFFGKGRTNDLEGSIANGVLEEFCRLSSKELIALDYKLEK